MTGTVCSKRASFCEVPATRERDCLEPRVNTEGAQHGADMVPHRLGAQMELLSDLPRRAAVLEEA